MSLARRAYEPGAFSSLRPSRKPSKRSEDPVTPEVYHAVMQRDRACVAGPPLGTACGGRTIWHHRKPVEHGGPSTVENGLRLCTRHHDRVHQYRTLARGLGLLLSRKDEPSRVPVTLVDGRRVLLTPDGTYEEGGRVRLNEEADRLTAEEFMWPVAEVAVGAVIAGHDRQVHLTTAAGTLVLSVDEAKRLRLMLDVAVSLVTRSGPPG